MVKGSCKDWFKRYPTLAVVTNNTKKEYPDQLVQKGDQCAWIWQWGKLSEGAFIMGTKEDQDSDD